MISVYSESLVIPASGEVLWESLTDPSSHAALDEWGTVGAPVSTEPLHGAGQVFTMNMRYDDGQSVHHYRSDNHVTVFEPGRAVAWMTSIEGEQPLGWTWRYDLEPVADGTEVTLTYDWTETSEKNLERFGVPTRTPDELLGSLHRLSDLVAPGQQPRTAA